MVRIITWALNRGMRMYHGLGICRKAIAVAVAVIGTASVDGKDNWLLDNGYHE
jgi:hypothetical protein